MTTTELAPIPKMDVNASASVYDRVDPMTFIKEMGKVFAMTGAGGCQKAADGELMALACISERRTIFDIARRYHLMSGKLVVKAETMLADWRTKAGGKHRWIKDGTDGQEAVLELTSREGEKFTYGFTMKRAVNAGYARKDSNWEKRPDQMLRSRCITDLIRMVAPEISNGEYSEDEIADVSVSASTPTNGTAVRSAEDVAKRAAELKASETASASSETTKIPLKRDDDVIDAEYQVTNDNGKPTAADSQRTAVVMEIESGITQCGWNVPEVVAKFNAKWGTSFTSIDQFPDDKQTTVLANIRNVIEKRRQTAMEEADRREAEQKAATAEKSEGGDVPF